MGKILETRHKIGFKNSGCLNPVTEGFFNFEYWKVGGFEEAFKVRARKYIVGLNGIVPSMKQKWKGRKKYWMEKENILKKMLLNY